MDGRLSPRWLGLFRGQLHVARTGTFDQDKLPKTSDLSKVDGYKIHGWHTFSSALRSSVGLIIVDMKTLGEN